MDGAVHGKAVNGIGQQAHVKNGSLGKKKKTWSDEYVRLTKQELSYQHEIQSCFLSKVWLEFRKN